MVSCAALADHQQSGRMSGNTLGQRMSNLSEVGCMAARTRRPITVSLLLLCQFCSGSVAGDRINMGKVYVKDQRMASQSHPLIACWCGNMSMLRQTRKAS